MSIQPYRGTQMIIIERRHADGTLDLRGEPQPPVQPMTFDALYDMYFRETPDSGPSASWDDLRAWLQSKGWVIRAKTW